ncbi:hypothetical protein RE474_07775 [Methanolobus sediminis]|uniref:Uncharacterized protein n=1 Tax=Methanolobus sediminis TaxID=3072978 RepID=A0AA51UIE2_9EURY|nr:hypothetical protein [Methanolobus sediminis]WMW24000.1 hypothetical protein RE474_07775 [Methanolobus sediminis]
MNKYLKMVLYGSIVWLVPFIISFAFVDRQGNFTIDETFFKSIMVVTGALVGVVLAVRYFRDVETNYVNGGIVLGVIWLVINLALDLSMVYGGFFQMSVTQYFTDIGMRYLSMPIYTIGMGCALMQKSR